MLRRPVSNGWGFDFNYTWSHSLDNVSGSETDGAGVQDAFNPNGYRGPSTFDIRHAVTANAVIELPLQMAGGATCVILPPSVHQDGDRDTSIWRACGLAVDSGLEARTAGR